MDIDHFRIKGLFDSFDYDFKFGTGESIMLIIGPNGYGKTTTLNLINILFNHSPSSLVRLPFCKIDVSFNDGSHLIAERLPPRGLDHRGSLPLKLIYHQGEKEEIFTPARISLEQNHPRVLTEIIEDLIPTLHQVGHYEWLDIETGSTLDLADVLEIYPNELPTELIRQESPIPDWLEEIKQSVNVRFVNTERLTRVLPRHWRRKRTINTTTRTVSHYSKELAHHIRESIAKYGALSQTLDSTFPSRLVAKHQGSNGSTERLVEDLDEIDKRRVQLERVGLLKAEQHGLEIPDLESVDEVKRDVLAVYAQDAKNKLAIFDELYDKVNTFIEIANSRFLHKHVAVNPKGLMVYKEDDTPLDLEKLSSGEQHELVMLYELLFRAPKNSLILIDEPEISLHVDWQEKWLKDLERIANLSDFRAIVATHSPEIIGDRWHLTVELHDRKDS